MVKRPLHGSMAVPSAAGSSDGNTETAIADSAVEPSPTSQGGLVKDSQIIQCPYLDTIDRHRLDFDFEKLCSVSLGTQNVYACLVCGKYFQGRGTNSHAYFHSIDEEHHVFINLQTLKVYCLPDNYEVFDSSLDDIKYSISPTFTARQVQLMDEPSDDQMAMDITGKTYLPGLVGLNNIKHNDYMNVVIQALAHVPPLRDFFLLCDLPKFESELVKRFGLLIRKIWSRRLFKAQVSPHEFLQQAVGASGKKFKLTEQGDALEFLSWLLNILHRDLGGTRKRDSSIIYKVFQGEIEITTQELDKKGGSVDTKMGDTDTIRSSGGSSPTRDVKQAPFLFLTLDLPVVPLFADEFEGSVIPQVPLGQLLKKFNGKTSHVVDNKLRTYRVIRLPDYLIFHAKRFNRNNWILEKNPTIVNFPVRNIDFADLLAATKSAEERPTRLSYDLLANVVHTGKPEKNEGIYKVHIRNRRNPDQQWFQIQDLIIEDIQAELVTLSETYIQIWEIRRNDNNSNNMVIDDGAGNPRKIL